MGAGGTWGPRCGGCGVFEGGRIQLKTCTHRKGSGTNSLGGGCKVSVTSCFNF